MNRIAWLGATCAAGAFEAFFLGWAYTAFDVMHGFELVSAYFMGGGMACAIACLMCFTIHGIFTGKPF